MGLCTLHTIYSERNNETGKKRSIKDLKNIHLYFETVNNDFRVFYGL